jgi:Tfp pilus assembly PilM family ATPase
MSRDVCAIDFSTNSIQILVRRRSGTVDSAEAVLPSEAIEDGRILQPVAIQLFVTRLFRDLHVKRPEIRVILADSACMTRFVDYPRMSPSHLERSLSFEATRELPMSIRNAYLAWHVVDVRESQQTVLLVGAWRDVVEGYLDALESLGHVQVVEPRSLALARAAGSPDSLLLDATGDRLQVTIVEQRRVTYTSSVLLANGAASSLDRLTHAAATLLPKANARRASGPARLILLGKFHSRTDIADALANQPAGQRLETVADWRPPAPYGAFAASCQVANIGLLMRN